LVTSTSEVRLPGSADFVFMFPDKFLDRPKLAVVQPVILRQLYSGLKPILSLPVGAMDVDVQTRFFAGKEEEPVPVLPKDRWTHW
jgi:hypothetical protein